MLQGVKIKEVMHTPVVTIGVDENFSRVEEKLRTKGIRHLPVVDTDDRVVGMITQRDLYRTLSPRVTEDGIYYEGASLNGFILKRIMTPNPVTFKPEDPLVKAVEVMGRNKFGAVPVVDAGGKAVGILTETDILRWLARQLM